MPIRLSSNVCIAAASLVLLPVVGCSSVQKSFRPNDKTVIAQADQVHGQLSPAVIQDAEVQRYMDAVGARIIEGAKAFNKDPGKEGDERNKNDNDWLYRGNIQFHLVNSKTLNAFTTGGQHVYIYNELFQQAKSEDELAAVMAHEFAHIYCRHVASGMTRQTEAGAVVALASLAGAAAGGGKSGGSSSAVSAGAAGAGAAAQFISQGYTRGDEDEADKYGFSFYIRAGWDPNHFADFFKRMIAMGYDKTPEMMSDHPKLSLRVEKTEARAKRVDPKVQQERRKPPIADAGQFQQIQQRAVAAARSTPDDKSLQAAQLMFNAFPSCVAPADQPSQADAKKRLIGMANQSGARSDRTGASSSSSPSSTPSSSTPSSSSDTIDDPHRDARSPASKRGR